jgi:carboxymethylenebutenolidase
VEASIEARYVEIAGLRAHLTTPGSGGRGAGTATLLLPMITGIGQRVREFADDIARVSQAPVLTWDPWHGPSADDTAIDDLLELYSGLTDADAMQELGILSDWLAEEHAPDGINIVGWCLGGRFALMLGEAVSAVASVVAYHPTIPDEPAATHTIDAIEQAKRIEAPVMVLYPGRDTLVSRATFDRLQHALQEREPSGPTITHVYPLAEHGFSDRSRHGNQANADAWAASWPHALALLSARRAI